MTNTNHPTWCHTHALTVSTFGLVPATRIDPFDRPQCERCHRTGEMLRRIFPGETTSTMRPEGWPE